MQTRPWTWQKLSWSKKAGRSWTSIKNCCLNEHSKAHTCKMTPVLSQCLELCCSQQYRQSKHLCVSDQQHQVNHARKDPGLHREGLQGRMYKCCAIMHAMECCCEATCRHELITFRPACQQPSKMTLFLMIVHSLVAGAILVQHSQSEFLSQLVLCPYGIPYEVLLHSLMQ